jgi:hypothetical protein
MFYRLTVTFGIPPERRYGPEVVWIVQLSYKLNDSILLRIQDFRGACLAWYSGVGPESYKALELLNWLASPEWAPPRVVRQETPSGS